MLLPARNKMGDNIGVSEKVESVVAALYGKFVFQSGFYAKGDGLRNEDIYVDLSTTPLKK